MSAVYFKAVRPDGTSFYDPRFRWLRKDGEPYTRPVRHPGLPPGNYGRIGAEGYLSVATVPTDCTGFRWPCRLLTVEPVGEVWTPSADLPSKRAALAWRVTGELPAHEVFGPQGEQVVVLIARASRLTAAEARRLAAALDAAWGAALGAAWGAALGAARGAARDAALNAACDAALALVVRDLITPDQFNALYGPWRDVIGDPS